MEPTLRGVRAKLDRAYEHFRTLRDESPSIVRGHRVLHDTVVLPHPDAHGYNFNLPKLDPLDANRWAVVLGDLLFNLRAALDQLVYQLHVVEYGSSTIPEAVERNSAFPIKHAAPRTKKGVLIQTTKWPQIANLPRLQRAVIQRYQPYNTRNDGLNERRAALALLEILNNVDKHRRLHIVRQVAVRARSPVFHKRYGFVSKPHLGAVRSGAKVDEWRFRFISDDVRGELAEQVDRHGVELQEVLDETGAPLPVFELTRHLQNKVLEVVEEFVPFFEEAGIADRELALPEIIKPATWEHWVGVWPI